VQAAVRLGSETILLIFEFEPEKHAVIVYQLMGSPQLPGRAFNNAQAQAPRAVYLEIGRQADAVVTHGEQKAGLGEQEWAVFNNSNIPTASP